MVLRFNCPNGHALTSPEHLAGRVGKCPHCGAKIKVPSPPAAASATPISADEATATTAESSPMTASDSGAHEDDGDTIVFLCPNEHRLHGPRSLEGKAGQCPHCGVRFRVPSSDDPPDEVDPGSQILVGERPAVGELAVQDVAVEEADEGPSFNFLIDAVQERGAPVPALAFDAPAGGASGGRHQLAELFVKLWDERARGAVVELHLADGATIAPDRFARELSRRDYGVFAVKEADGTHTLTLVAWDAIRRISFRRVAKLPKKVFD